MTLIYDPPEGWRYGFPKLYEPLPGEKLQDTLVRDGYPEHLAQNPTYSGHVRFIGNMTQIEETMKRLDDGRLDGRLDEPRHIGKYSELPDQEGDVVPNPEKALPDNVR